MPRMHPEDRFLQYVEIHGADECWPWIGHAVMTATGLRGRFWYLNRSQWAPRVAYLMFVGPLADDQKACHKCDNGICVNPNHLFSGTDADNATDKMLKGRAYRASQVQTHCWRGHEFTLVNTRWQLNKRTGYRYRQCEICLKFNHTRYHEKARNARRISR